MARFALACILFIGLIPSVVSAQFMPTGIELFSPDISMRAFPVFPEPGDEVILRLESNQVPVSGSTITWTQDDTIIPAAANQTTYRFVMPTEPTTISVSLSTTNGLRFSDTITIQPVRVDLLVEADTVVPVFYTGRSLPTTGSVVRVTAIPVLEDSISPSNYTYNWTVDGNPMLGGTGQGSNSIIIPTQFESSAAVKVTISNQAGAVVAEDETVVSMVQPEIHFYETNPLRGIIPTALQSPHIFSGMEIMVKAEPYYFNRNARRGDIKTTWNLNRRVVNQTADNPLTITLRRQGDRGQFNLSFEAHNRTAILQKAEGDLLVRY